VSILPEWIRVGIVRMSCLYVFRGDDVTFGDCLRKMEEIEIIGREVSNCGAREIWRSDAADFTYHI